MICIINCVTRVLEYSVYLMQIVKTWIKPKEQRFYLNWEKFTDYFWAEKWAIDLQRWKFGINRIIVYKQIDLLAASSSLFGFFGLYVT